MKVALGLVVVEPELSLLGVSQDPIAVRTAAEAMVRDLAPPGDDPLARARQDALRRVAGGGS